MRRVLMTLIAAGALATGFGAVQQKGQPDVDLQAAIRKETVEGDLKGAIAAYSKLAQGADRSVAARALLRLAGCYEKQGNAEAKKTYEQLVKGFADQKAEAEEARTKLAAMEVRGSDRGSQPRARLAWDDAVDLWGTISADGRYLSFVDWSSGDLALRDLQANQSRRLTDHGGYAKAEGEAEASTVSPDGKRVAFNWSRWGAGAMTRALFELRLIGTDGKGERVLYRAPAGSYLEPHSWSPNGKWIAVCRDDGSMGKPGVRGAEVMLIDSESGESRVLETRSKSWKQRISFSPDGKWLAYHSELVRQSGDKRLFVVPADGSATAEKELAADAEMMAWAPDGQSVFFGRVRNGAGELYQLPVSDGRATGEPRQIRTASSVTGASLGMTARGTLMIGYRDLRVDGHVAEYEAGTGRLGNTIHKIPVRPWGMAGIGGNVRFSPNGKEFLLGVAVDSIRIQALKGGAGRTINPQMTVMHRVEWAPDGASLLVSGVGRDGREGLFRVDPASGAASFLVPIKAAYQFAVSPDASRVFHKTERGIAAYELDSGIDKLIFEKDLEGITEVSLSRDGKKLAVTSGRYLGIVDVATGQTRAIVSEEASPSIIVWGCDWSADDRNLITVERAADLRDRSEVRAYPVEGGETLKQPLLGQHRGVSISPDGKYIGTSRWEIHLQVWALENFLPSTRQ